MSAFLHDLRYAIRILLKNPGFTLVAVVTLALGIGANTALFSVIDAVLLRPLPFHEPARLVAVRSVDPKNPDGEGSISYPAFLDWREQSHSFEGMAVWNTNNFTYTGGDQPIYLLFSEFLRLWGAVLRDSTTSAANNFRLC
jgi:hypothetical protein